MTDAEIRQLLDELASLRENSAHREVVAKVQGISDLSSIRAGLRFPLVEMGSASCVALGEHATATELLKKLGKKTVEDYKILAGLASTFLALEKFEDAEHMCLLAGEAKRSQEARRKARGRRSE